MKSNFNLKILEATLLFILSLNILRTNQLTIAPLLAILSLLLAFFLICSFFNFHKFKVLLKIRFYTLFIFIIILFGSVLLTGIQDRISNSQNVKIHDGALQTEMASMALLKGKNPYDISYQAIFSNTNDPKALKNPIADHFVYSPVTFLITIPFFLVTNTTLGFVDIRFPLLILFVLSGYLGTLIVKEKLIFLIIFLLNPLFLNMLLAGTNESMILFFFVLSIVFLVKHKISMSTVMLALATSTKLIILPFVPLYFLYLFVVNRNKLRKVINQLMLFTIINLLIYLPFFIWNPNSLVDDLILYPFKGGASSHQIAGWVGIPQWLVLSHLLPTNSGFPFYIISIPFSLVFLYMSLLILKKSPNTRTLLKLFVAFFLLVFTFSRVIQTNYLAFIAQALILLSFLPQTRLEKK